MEDCESMEIKEEINHLKCLPYFKEFNTIYGQITKHRVKTGATYSWDKELSLHVSKKKCYMQSNLSLNLHPT